MTQRTVNQWLHAINDCGVLRVAFDCDVLIEAWELGLVDASPVEDHEGPLDFTLTVPGLSCLELSKVAA
jgi:hypothetical protein